MSSSSSNPNLLSVQFPEIFEVALEEYTKKTERDIKSDPLFAKLQDCNSSNAVLKVLEEQALAFEQYRKGDRKVQLLRRLKPIVEIFFRLSTKDDVKEGIVSIFPPAKAIFTGIGLLLETAKRVSDDYDALIELFEHFERYLRRLQVFTTIPPALGEILVEIMVELLGVLALTTRQINQRRFKKFATKLFLGENDVEQVLQRLDLLTKEELGMTATQTLEVVNGLFKDMKTVIDGGKASMNNIREALVTMQKTISDDLNNIRGDQEREKIQKWLSPPDPSTNHNKACEVHQKVTPCWFLEGSIYNEWKAKGCLLWAHGNPGSGKSILCSSIIEDIKPKCATGLDSFAYYYFDFNDIGKQDRRGLLSSLLIQLCTRSHRGYDILLNLFGANANGLGQPSEVDMIQCLKKVLELLCYGRVYIIVDAVDESPIAGMPSPREKVLELIKELVDLRHPKMRFCITSRPEVDIRRVLELLPFPNVSLDDQAGQKRDIVKYIESVVGSDPNMQRWTPEDRQLVIDSLSQKAKGMFRWVYCQLDRLRRCYPTDIRMTLDELPVTLDETYERILLGIDKEKRKHAIRLLQCLAFTRRPLRVNELAEVLATRFDAGQIPRLHKDQRSRKPDEDVLLAGSTLITTIKPSVHGNTRVVQFSHYSVVEFLMSERLASSKNEDLSQYYISTESSHTTLAQSCIGTLLQLDNHIQGVTQDFPLAEYAAQNWFHHAQYKDVAPRIQDGMNCLFDPNRNHFTVWVSVHNIDHVPSHSQLDKPSNPPEPSPLYYATLCGIRCVVEYLIITCQQDPNKSHGGRGTPLHAAAVLGHTAIVQFLLEHAADVNSRDKHNSTPLHEASGSGNIDVMRLLLSRGAHVNVFDHREDSPLHKASRYQRFNAVKLLVKGGADVNVRGKSNSTPLHEVSGSGSLHTMQLLLSLGADVNALDHQGDSALHKASRYHKVDAVELLVKRGADVDVRNKFNSTVLHEASGVGNIDATRFLVSVCADVNALDDSGDSPLHIASRFRTFDVAELLVNGGADVNVRDKFNSTVLHEASGNGRIDMTRLLLSLGADVNALDDWGDSPLHKALRIRKFIVAELLVKSGADMNVRNKFNSTVLHEASGVGYIDITWLLLGVGADVNALDDWGDSPLHKALRIRKFDVAELLVKSGANVNVRNKFNSTVLHEASGVGSIDITQLLLGLGADVNALDDWGDSPLHKASRISIFDVAELLVKSGADMNVRNKFNSTVLHEASGVGSIDMTRLLLSLDTDINALDDWGDSPLHKALRIRKFDAAELLVKGGADLNVRNKFNSTVLDEASGGGDLNVIRWLLSHNADANTLDNRGDSPLHKASRFQKFDVAEFLVKGGADVNIRNKSYSTPLHEASGNGDLDIARLLLSHGADINALDHQEGSPLFKALRQQKIDVLEFLLKGGADVNVRDKFNSTLLHKASGIGNPEITKLLLSYGTDVNTLDDQGDSPLHKAVRFQKLDVARLLVDHGADVNARNISNSTPLHEASGNGDLDITRLLLSHGTDVNVFNDRGDSPLHKALRFRKSDVAELLVKGGADVDVRDKSNSTPLLETGIGNLKTVQLRHGNAQGRNHKTPLHSASFEGESRSLNEHEADADAENDEGHTPALAAHGKLLNDSVPGENMAEGTHYIWIMTAVAVATVAATTMVKRFR